MANLDDVRRIVRRLPETSETTSHGNVCWNVKDKGFAWERPLRKADLAALGDAAPKGTILAARVGNLMDKDLVLASGADVFFTTPHFDGYPAVLVRLGKISRARLEDLLQQAWLCRAPKTLVKAFRDASTAARAAATAKPHAKPRTAAPARSRATAPAQKPVRARGSSGSS